MTNRKYIIVGGAGFIGSHFCDRLLSEKETERLTIYDNFSSGREWHYQHHVSDKRFQVIRGDVKNLAALTKAMAGHDTVIHLASNPDIARAAREPDIDFREGTQLTQNVVEAMRVSGASRILYASGSGVYGDLGELAVQEDHGPLVPTSTYGASKLAGEALISSYSFMFGINGFVFRFGNVVGPRQTHGVGFDFTRRLLEDPTQLRILGDGKQCKSYIYVTDVVNAVLMADRNCKKTYEAFNVATGDYITVHEIADIALECLAFKSSSVKYCFTGGDRGWKGDVPIVKLNTDRIRSLGWARTKSSHEAIKAAILAMIPDAKAGKL